MQTQVHARPAAQPVAERPYIVDYFGEHVPCALPAHMQRDDCTPVEVARLRNAYRHADKYRTARLFAESGLTAQAFGRALGWVIQPGAVK